MILCKNAVVDICFINLAKSGEMVADFNDEMIS